MLSPEGTIKTARELGEISRSANVPASFQPILTNPADPLRRDIIQVLEEESSAGARVWGQSTPRDFNMNCRLNETSMLLMGTPVWNDMMKLPDEERLEAFNDPSQQTALVDAMEQQQQMMKKMNGGRKRLPLLYLHGRSILASDHGIRVFTVCRAAGSWLWYRQHRGRRSLVRAAPLLFLGGIPSVP